MPKSTEHERYHFHKCYKIIRPTQHGASLIYLSRSMRFPAMWNVRPAKAQTSLIRAFADRLSILLTKHHLEFLSLKRCCTCSSESTLVKMPHCWKSHVTVHLLTLVSYRSKLSLNPLANGLWSIFNCVICKIQINRY